MLALLGRFPKAHSIKVVELLLVSIYLRIAVFDIIHDVCMEPRITSDHRLLVK